MSAFWPFIVIGLFTGSVYGLSAMGVVLTYKTVGVFNLAYGAVAMFCAYTYWELHDHWHLSAWIAMPILFLVVAPIIGIALEALYRPLAGLSAEVLIVVSLGVLALLASLVPIIYGSQDRQLQAIFPIKTFVLGSHLHVGYDQMGTLLISLLMAGVLWALLRHTSFGTSTRAVVDNPDLADMIGIHGDNIRRAAWILSSVFAALVGILISPSQGLDINQLILVVIFAFAPAVLGFLYGLPAAYLGGLALGILGSILSKYSNSGTVANIEAALPYLAFFALLVLFGPRLKEVGAATRPLSVARTTSAAVGNAGRRASKFVVGVAGRRVGLDRRLAVGLAAFVLALMAPLAFHGLGLFIITGAMIYALIALTLVVLTGWAGQISLAQFAFVGVGAFTVGHLSGTHGEHFLFATLIGVLLAAPLGLIVGAASLRLSGLYLALATLAFALIMDQVVFNRVDVSRGITGITVPRPQFFGISFTGRASLYELVAIIFGLAAITAYALRNGPIGRRLHILRDSPLAASTLGVNLVVTKLIAFTICGMVAALGGALYGAWQQSITPFDFMWSASLQLLLVVVLGGRSNISGALLAGTTFGVLIIPGIPPDVTKAIQLTIAFGVIGLAQEPEGTVAMTKRQTNHVMAVMRPLPRRRSRRAGAAAAPAAVVVAGTTVAANGGPRVNGQDRRVAATIGAREGTNGHAG